MSAQTLAHLYSHGWPDVSPEEYAVGDAEFEAVLTAGWEAAQACEGCDKKCGCDRCSSSD